MDRRTLERALRPLERAEWLSLLPPDRRIDLPDIGAFVIYYPEGHREVRGGWVECAALLQGVCVSHRFVGARGQ